MSTPGIEETNVLESSGSARAYGDPGDPGAMLEICRDVLSRVAPLWRFVPPSVIHQVEVALADLELFQRPEALPVLAAPPPETLILGDGRRLVYLEDIEAEDMRGLVLRFWGDRAGKGLGIGASSDLVRHGRLLHVSLSYVGHLPSWKDVRLVKERFFGDVDAMMVLPKAEDYVNVQQFCFHLWQMPSRWAVM